MIRRDRGSVTAEMAAALPALVVVLGAALWAVAVVGARLECVDAARAGARAAARGDGVPAVREGALAVAPSGASVEVTVGASLTEVTVRARVRPSWAVMLPGVVVSASATSATEKGVLP
ncbi:TadE family type IV pilus minor pilin [Herbidospora mongoliensis]|uniref:TadE family type IV pilus minor pilin n=1 Tax=Herbidospora mongoliensis TaxID=688067 RepID=UPI0008361D2E|nr:TadE family type IV pilus minor pilin [Herbidospora mongoliensis]